MRENFTIRIDPDDRKKLEEIAQEKDIKLGTLIHYVLKYYIRYWKRIKLL